MAWLWLVSWVVHSVRKSHSNVKHCITRSNSKILNPFIKNMSEGDKIIFLKPFDVAYRYKILPLSPCCTSLCKFQTLSFCPAWAWTSSWCGDKGMHCIFYLYCIYGRPIMQQPQHVLYCPTFEQLLRLALFTCWSVKDWKTQTIPKAIENSLKRILMVGWVTTSIFSCIYCRWLG